MKKYRISFQSLVEIWEDCEVEVETDKNPYLMTDDELEKLVYSKNSEFVNSEYCYDSERLVQNDFNNREIEEV